jgi:ribose/xylose/arabinose/galactoside ABC-type transport system permease subunit
MFGGRPNDGETLPASALSISRLSNFAGATAGAVAGVVIITVLQNGLAQVAFEPGKRLVTKAAVVIVVLIFQLRGNRHQE